MLRRIGRLARREDGFGLIELTIALTMLAIGISALGGLFIAGHLALRRASESDTAAVLADKLFERFRAQTWDSIGLSSALLSDPSVADTKYTSDPAYDLATAVVATDPSDPCYGTTPLYSVCYPSRTAPDSFDTTPDGRRYRIDTYINWACSTAADDLDTSVSPPICKNHTSGDEDNYSQVKQVTVVVRDVASGADVYRTSSTFDRLAGGSMPTVTVSPSTGTTGTSTTTTTTSSPTSAPDPPTSVALADGGGSGSAYVDSGNVKQLSFDVQLDANSLASDMITLSLSDGDPTHDVTAAPHTATLGAGLIHFTGIDATGLTDGPITVSVTATNSYGSSQATTVTVTKDTVAPDPPASVALQNGQGQGNAYVNSAVKSNVSVAVGVDAYSLSTDTVSVALTDGSTTTGAATAPAPAGAGTVTVTGVNASSLADGSITALATVTDAAGNTSSSVTSSSFTKDTVAPTLTGIASANKSGGTANKAEAGDTITLTFSEPVLGSSVAASSNVTMSVVNGAGKPITLTIPNLVTSGGFTIGNSGSGGYLAQSGGTVAFSSSSLSQPTSTQVRVTLGSCSGSCTSLQAGGSVSVTVGASSSLTDLAGNAVSSSTLSPAAMSFF